VTPAPTQPISVATLLELYEQRGDERYGERVTQLHHALQCASLARRAEADDALVAAALLHDVGHLVSDERDATHDDADDRHEAVGARLLASLLGSRVATPVALHVLAKRWRCATEPAYRDGLSPASRTSLLAQGGPLDAAQCARFEELPAHREAVALRTWDDLAKDPQAPAGTIGDFEPLLVRLADEHATLGAG
jgi:[1-hydroxy-2-(trimethylamino)ethyl]phosphonate dioxygenase